MNPNFWLNKKVFITGHTGFKGSWLSLWLLEMGAIVKGYSLAPPTTPSLFEEMQLWARMESIEGDIRDFMHLRQEIHAFKPDIVFHMAAQPLVRLSYDEPIETYSTNVMGTVYLLEAVKQVGGIKAVVNITSDKCYENKEWVWGYRENEPMGGYDPYSNSKGCAELVASSYRQSFFNKNKYHEHGCAIASVRAGNVIGGGDWALDRLIPDMLKAFSSNEKVEIRNPHSIRPWQHVLEPLSGYITVAEHLYNDGCEYAEGWNFGPKDEDAKSVEWIANQLSNLWGNNAEWFISAGEHPHEAHYLKLDCSKAKMRLDWQAVWNLQQTLEKIVNWQKAWLNKEDMHQYTINEIKEYMIARAGNK
ncbi:CDP-glucose 4,6-dehydratase [Providencia alcalifaciens]|uniref:CDP-glucose 4,6-dehydratase n=1 Tax=Providencia alcalifaciens TaxID=126385 RepID=UPI0004521A7F|nr:CDP-glucose 4,6-dehydratase [Providencia alcalifaciens]ETT07719.1 CDP-glucose 4,6-dehydratase [Providencia alcalifaciens F90-2004]EUC94982.1 CDP-glucose 4,6-dehydratase [Providencia alcalifaciens PAL-2]MTB33177.1 CDP-glucose 4,6-dehydratase [Providencia alcalifaciens]MTC97586.1 CDP-glucose 4,6-dehydratase [Providencia alcalifaciens]